MKGGPWVAVVLMPVFFAGCLGDPKEGSLDVRTEDSVGTIHGIVTDDEFLPLPGVVVRLRTVSFSPFAMEDLTKADGSFLFERVPLGPQVLMAQKANYLEFEQEIVVVAGEVIEPKIQLRPIPSTTSRIVALAPLQGSYDCAAAWGAESGSCDNPVKSVAGQGAFQTRNNHTIEIPSGWGGLLLELVWRTGQQSSLDGVRFLAESSQGNGTYADVHTTGNRTRIAIDRGSIYPGASLNHSIPTDGAKLYLRLLPVGKLDGATCETQCLRGIGAGVDLEYSVYTTLFLGTGVDRSYSAVPA